ncbi:hypothetical protein ATANTOWER_028749 [Ataeniobius toweri]|uniref:Uncharacterized protein n=1 Tax=Ataeniobius toweri TaxID=208326 RepID=A0ABU7BUD8_9TELE|nr:hypothetical protein [Ataeniobius toweri]
MATEAGGHSATFFFFHSIINLYFPKSTLKQIGKTFMAMVRRWIFVTEIVNFCSIYRTISSAYTWSKDQNSCISQYHIFFVLPNLSFFPSLQNLSLRRWTQVLTWIPVRRRSDWAASVLNKVLNLFGKSTW